MAATREDNIYFARLAEQGERYDDMIRYMTAVTDVSQLVYIYIYTITITSNQIKFIS